MANLFDNRLLLNDEKFPTDLKEKINSIIDVFFDDIKYKSYEIEFNLLTSEVIFNFDFGITNINVSIHYLTILDNNIEDVFHIIYKLIDQEFKKIWYKEG